LTARPFQPGTPRPTGTCVGRSGDANSPENKTVNQQTKGDDMVQIEKTDVAETLEAELALFTGTTRYYRHWLGIHYTDGIHYLAERAGAYWLIDAIASWQPTVRAVEEEFQLWELTVDENNRASLTARSDTGTPAIIEQKIDYTDFPLKSLTLYLENGVLLLPSEH
jgi:hypothetical protein